MNIGVGKCGFEPETVPTPLHTPPPSPIYLHTCPPAQTITDMSHTVVVSHPRVTHRCCHSHTCHSPSGYTIAVTHTLGTPSADVGQLPGWQPYSASKHAVEAISDALRVELMPFDVSVSLIKPGSIKTAIWVCVEQRSIPPYQLPHCPDPHAHYPLIQTPTTP